MRHRYAVVGAGRQGLAAAHDLARFGDAAGVLLVDADGSAATAGAARLNGLLGQPLVASAQADVTDSVRMQSLLTGVSALISAVPYGFNLALTELAIRLGAGMCDLGGNTAVTRQQLEHDAGAVKAGVTIVPDCGMGPGMNVSLGAYAMSLVDKPRELYIWVGGLPQKPAEPWNYELAFNIGGLTNEYDGPAQFLRNGRVTEVPCLDGIETLDFPPPLGRLEAAVTSGGLSTMPWTLAGVLDRLEDKTLRYPGHWAQFRAFAQLGLLDQKPIHVGQATVVPRDVLHALLEPQIRAAEGSRDVGIIRAVCVGEAGGRRAEATVQLIDRYDESTGFTAMQRLTGTHASIVAILAAQGRLSTGAVPVERVPAAPVVHELRRRGFVIEESVAATGRS